jgi:hypothetical protein
MAITAAEIVFRYSVKTGSAGDTTAQATPTHATTGSLGKYVSTTAWAGGTNSLFDNITGDENAASTVDYRCFFVLNAHGTLTLENAVIYVSAEQAGGASVAIALDSTAISRACAGVAPLSEIAVLSSAIATDAPPACSALT